MMDLYLSIGSNIGDRKANLCTAIDMLNERLEEHIATSSFLETESWGFKSKPFVNAALHYRSERSPEDILLICKQIERKMGRSESLEYDESGKRIYHDRIIDIDILIYGDITMNTQNLTIPHPLMYEREFVMLPLKEIFQQKTLHLQDCNN